MIYFEKKINKNKMPSQIIYKKNKKGSNFCYLKNIAVIRLIRYFV